MAKKLKGDERGEVDGETGKTVLPNTEARDVSLQDGFADLLELEREKADLKAEHLADVEDRIKKTRKNITTNTGIEAADWKHFYAIYKREQDAALLEDEGDKDRILTNLRDTFHALSKGDMVDFVKVMEQAQAA